MVVQRAAVGLLDLGPADGRDGERAAVALARDPAQIEEPVRDRGADRACEMRAPLAPVDAGTAERAPAAARGGQVDSQFVEEHLARLGDDAAIVAELDVAMLLQRVGERDAKLASDVVVAHACLAHRVVDANGAQPRRCDCRDRRDAFQHLRDMRSGEPEVTVAALLRRGDQVGGAELAEMPARGLRRDVRRIGELARRQRAPVEQRAQDVGAGGITHQCRNRGHIENFAHGNNIAPGRRSDTPQRFGRARTGRRPNLGG